MIKLSTITIFAICLLYIVPPVIRNSIYVDNVFFAIMYAMFAFFCLSAPFMAPKMNYIVKRISCLVGGWSLAGLIFELINFSMPEIVLNSFDNDTIYLQFLIAFTVGIAFIITSEAWTKQKK